MKTPEDEAFEDIERRQGGFQAKRQMAADKLQENVPLYVSKPAFESWREFASDYERGFIDGMQKQAQSSVDKAVNQMAQPPQSAQEPQYEYLIDDLAEWKQYVEVDNAPYGLREHVTKVLLAHGIKGENA